ASWLIDSRMLMIPSSSGANCSIRCAPCADAMLDGSTLSAAPPAAAEASRCRRVSRKVMTILPLCCRHYNRLSHHRQRASQALLGEIEGLLEPCRVNLRLPSGRKRGAPWRGGRSPRGCPTLAKLFHLLRRAYDAT